MIRLDPPVRKGVTALFLEGYMTFVEWINAMTASGLTEGETGDLAVELVCRGLARFDDAPNGTLHLFITDKGAQAVL
jgi:hypothetical protein